MLSIHPVSIVLSFSELHKIGILQYAAFRIDFLHLVFACVRGHFMSFLGFIAHLFSMLDNIPFCGHVSIHRLLKDTLLASQDLASMSKAAMNIHVRLLCGLGFSFSIVILGLHEATATPPSWLLCSGRSGLPADGGFMSTPTQVSIIDSIDMGS